MTETQVFREHAHLAVPRLELFALEKEKHLYGQHISDVFVDDMGFALVREPEQVLGRFLCLGGVTIAVASDGRPHRVALAESGSFEMVTAARGGINVLVTDRRVVGVVQEGDSPWGRLTFDRVLLWDLDLRDIDSVSMEAKSGLLGTKEKPLIIHSYLPLMGIRLEVFAIPEVGGGGRKEKSCRPLMETLVSAAASAQMACFTEGSSRYQDLDRLRSGQWQWDPAENEFVADFTDDDDELCLDDAGGRADRPHWSGAESAAVTESPPAEQWWR